MILFETIWAALYEHGACAGKEEGTRRFWNGLSAEEQRRAYTTITQRLKEGKFVQYDPIRAIKEAVHRYGTEKQQLSFADYYARYGTTEEKDGWKMENPTGNQVIYVRG